MLRAYSAGFPEEAPETDAGPMPDSESITGLALLDEETGPGRKQTEPMENGR
jgi:hypothetical protein